MSDLIGTLIASVLRREGGSTYTNDPQDAGGPTKYGITLGALANWRGRNAAVGAEDVRKLTENEAVLIYRKRYFPDGFEAIKEPMLLELLFDFGVNSGPAAAVMALQTVLKRLGHYTSEIDGDFGPLSRAALAKVTNMPALFYAVKCERYELYQRYIGSSWSQAKYATGWANRMDGFELKF